MRKALGPRKKACGTENASKHERGTGAWFAWRGTSKLKSQVVMQNVKTDKRLKKKRKRGRERGTIEKARVSSCLSPAASEEKEGDRALTYLRKV